MTDTAKDLSNYLGQECGMRLPHWNKRRPIDHLHAEVAVLADPGERAPVQLLHDARWLQDTVDKAMRQLVDDARADGATWQQIGDALGTTRQAAQMRFGK